MLLQPPLFTLLDSSSKPALSPLFYTHIDQDLPDDSFICTLQDDTKQPTESSQPIASTSATPAYIPHSAAKGSTIHPVIHIQSPTVRTTYIQAGGSQARWNSKGKGRAAEPLGVELPWLGMQIKRLGRRDLAFEVGLVDVKGGEGILRFSSFQVSLRWCAVIFWSGDAKAPPFGEPTRSPLAFTYPGNAAPSQSCASP